MVIFDRDIVGPALHAIVPAAIFVKRLGDFRHVDENASCLVFMITEVLLYSISQALGTELVDDDKNLVV